MEFNTVCSSLTAATKLQNITQHIKEIKIKLNISVTCPSHHTQVTKTSRLTLSSSYLPSAHIPPSLPGTTCIPAVYILTWPNYSEDDTIFKHYVSYSGHISIYFSVLKIIWIAVRT